MFSADYPYSSMAEARTFLEQLPVSLADKNRIAHGNAERLLRAPPATLTPGRTTFPELLMGVKSPDNASDADNFTKTAYSIIEKAYIITLTRDHVKSDEYNK